MGPQAHANICSIHINVNINVISLYNNMHFFKQEPSKNWGLLVIIIDCFVIDMLCEPVYFDKMNTVDAFKMYVYYFIYHKFAYN